MILEFLNNGSIAAFVGAFSAFILIVLTDIRRRYRTKRLLRHLVSDNFDHARHKIESVRMNIALVRERNKIIAAPVMRFPVSSIRIMQHEVLDLLNANEKQALDALLYWMEAIDDLIGEGTKSASNLKLAIKRNAPNEERTSIANDFLELMEEAEKNLELLVELCQSFISGRAHEIIEFSHPVGGENDT
jgi:hypothetical protein